MSASRLPPRPYPGIRPFNKDEWRIFYGRNAIINSVIDRLSDRQIIFVHGRSGCGKSSLIKAGVLPRLEREHSRYGMHWQTAQMRPGGSPLWNMAVAFAQLLPGHNADEAPELEAIESVLKRLYRGREALTYLAEELKIGQEASACILVDQFEELFRYSDNVNLDEATLFADVLSGFAHNPPEGIHAIATMRSDFLGDCANFEGLAELINESQFLLPKLTGNQLRDAITTPARLFGGEVSDDLASLLIQESRKHADALPLVEHCLMYLWQAAQREAPPEGHEGPWPVLTTDQFPGLRAALSDRADEVLRTLKGEVIGAGKATEFLFRAIIEVDAEGRATRRPLRRSEILNITGRDEETIDRIVEAFADPETNFLLLSNEAEEDPVIDMTHEALIRCWGQLTDETIHVGQPNGWIIREAADAQFWRDLIARSSDSKDVIPSRLLPERQEAYDRIAGPAWAERYGGQWKQVKALFTRSHAEARKERWRTILTNVGIAAAGIMIALSLYFNSQSTQATNRLLKFELSGKLANDVEAWNAAKAKLRTAVSSKPLRGLYSDRADTAMTHQHKELALALEYLPNPAEAADFERTLEKLDLEFDVETGLRSALSAVNVGPNDEFAYSDQADEIFYAAYSHRADRLAIASGAEQIRVLGFADGDVESSSYIAHGEPQLTRMFWDSLGERLLLSAWGGGTAILNVADQQRVSLAGATDLVSDVAWSADGSVVYTASFDDTIGQYDSLTGELLQSWGALPNHADVNAIALSPDETKLIAGVDTGGDTSLVLVRFDGTELDPDNPEQQSHAVAESFATLGDTYAVDWSSDGRWIVAGYATGGFSVFDAVSGDTHFDYPDYAGRPVWSVSIDPTSQRVAVVATDGRAAVFDLRSKMQIAELEPSEGSNFGPSPGWSEDGQVLFVKMSKGVGRFNLTDILRLNGAQAIDDLAVWVRDARRLVSRCFTGEERENLGLTPAPPQWCEAKPPYLTEGLYLSALDELGEENWTSAIGTWTRARSKSFAGGSPLAAAESFQHATNALADRAWKLISEKYNADRDRSNLSEPVKAARESTKILLENVGTMADSRKTEVFQGIVRQLVGAAGSPASRLDQDQALAVLAEINALSENAATTADIALMMANLQLFAGEVRDAVWLVAEAIDLETGHMPTAENVNELLPETFWGERELGRLPDDQRYLSIQADGASEHLLISGEAGSGSSGAIRGVIWDLGRRTVASRIWSEGSRYAFKPTGEAFVAAQSRNDNFVPSIWTADGASEILQFQRDPTNPAFDTSEIVDWSADGRWIASSNYNQITIWDAETGIAKHVLTPHIERVIDLKFSPDGAYLASTGYDAVAVVTDVSTGVEIRMEWLDNIAVRISWAPSGENIALGGEGRFWIWEWSDYESPTAVDTDSGFGQSYSPFEYSPDGTLIALMAQNRLQVWETATMQPIFASRELGRGVSWLTWLPNSREIVTLSRDGLLLKFAPIDFETEIAQILADDPKCFSGEERANMQLAAEPPAWCRSEP